MTPAEGLLCFMSAITLVLTRVWPFTTAPKKLRGGSAQRADSFTPEAGRFFFARSTTLRLCSIIVLSVVGMMICDAKGNAHLKKLEEGATYF